MEVDSTNYQLSIVVPSIGRDSLPRLLNSIHDDNSLLEHEILIIGASTMIQKYYYLAKKYTCVKFLTQEDGKVSKSRNMGVENARFSLISFIDDDDIWLPDRALSLSNKLKENPNVIVFGSAVVLNEDSKKRKSWVNNQIITEKIFFRQFVRPLFLKSKLFLQVGNCAFYKSRSIPNFREDIEYLEDQIWIYEFLLQGNAVLQIDKITIEYSFSRIRSANRWNLQTEKNIFNFLNSINPKSGEKYIANISLKSLAISANRSNFIECAQLIQKSFVLKKTTKFNLFLLSKVNYIFHLFNKLW